MSPPSLGPMTNLYKIHGTTKPSANKIIFQPLSGRGEALGSGKKAAMSEIGTVTNFFSLNNL